MKKIFLLITTLIIGSLLLSSCNKDNLSSTVPGTGESSLLIRQQNKSFTLPVIRSTRSKAYSGTVSWGDGSKVEDYVEGLSHTFRSGDRSEIRVSGETAATVHFQDLDGVDFIDLSAF